MSIESCPQYIMERKTIWLQNSKENRTDFYIVYLEESMGEYKINLSMANWTLIFYFIQPVLFEF